MHLLSGSSGALARQTRSLAHSKQHCGVSSRMQLQFFLPERGELVGMLRTYAQQVCRASSGWAEKRCEPCEAAADALKSMGLEMRMDMATAQQHASKLDPRWQIVQDDQQRLRLRKTLRTKNFTKALELFQRVGQLAEAEGHHPDLHLEGWNNVTLELWTHARDGLSDNDFIVAAKIDALGPDLADLLSKKQPPMPGSES